MCFNKAIKEVALSPAFLAAAAFLTKVEMVDWVRLKPWVMGFAPFACFSFLEIHVVLDAFFQYNPVSSVLKT